MEVDVEDGRPAIRELTIGPVAEPMLAAVHAPRRPGVRDGSPRPRARITGEVLRDLPLAGLARYALLAVALKFGEGRAVRDLASRLRRREPGFPRINPGRGKRAHLVGFEIIDSPESRRLWSEYLDVLDAHAKRRSNVTRRNRITDELLERVALEYRRAIEENRPPKKAVQAAEGVSEATAGRYIARAREQGFLGRTVRGKKGEIDRGRP